MIYSLSALFYRITASLYDIPKLFNFLPHLKCHFVTYFLLLTFQGPFEQFKCLLLIFLDLIHFFNNFLSELTIGLDFLLLYLILCKIKLVLQLRNIRIYLFLSISLNLKSDFIYFLLNLIILREVLDKSLEEVRGLEN